MPTSLLGTAEKDCGGRASATRHEKRPVTGQILQPPRSCESGPLSDGTSSFAQDQARLPQRGSARDRGLSRLNC